MIKREYILFIRYLGVKINNKSLYNSICYYDFALHILVKLVWSRYEEGMVYVGCSMMSFLLIAADIDIIFRRALKGEYGKFYGGISCADVLGWFNKYYQEKSEACVQWNIEKSSEYHYYSPRSSEAARAKELEFHKVAAEYYRRTMTGNRNE